MTIEDRDRMIELFVFYDFIDDWIKDDTSEIREADRNKLKNILRTTLDLMVQYRKLEGLKAVETILEESKKYKFAMILKEDNVKFTDTFEHNILKTAMKKVIKDCTQCDLCKRGDYKYCEWFTIKKFLDEKQINTKKKDCPYRGSVEDIFDFGDDEL